MKKVILVVLTLVGFMTMNVQAQMAVGGTVGLQVPVGDFAEGINMGFGITVIGKYMVKDNLALGASVGYSQFGTDIEDVNLSIRPITGLVEYHFGTEGVRPYIGADVGVYTVKANVKSQGVNVSASESYLGFAPTGGLIFGKSESLSFVVNAKYHFVMSEGASTSWLGANFGVIFQL
jgi:outer membrane protein W